MDLWRGDRLESLVIEARFENGLNTAVGTGLECHGPTASGFQSLGAVAVHEAEDTQAGTIAEFWMGTRVEEVLDSGGRGRTDGQAALDHVGTGPFEVLMFLGPVLGQCGVLARHETAQMSGNATSLQKDLDGGGRKANFDLLVDVEIGNAVVVAFDLNMVVKVDLGLLPLGKDEGFGGQWFQPRLVEFLKQAGPSGVQLAEATLVELDQQVPNGQVQLGQAVKGLLADSGQDPAFDH